MERETNTSDHLCVSELFCTLEYSCASEHPCSEDFVKTCITKTVVMAMTAKKTKDIFYLRNSKKSPSMPQRKASVLLLLGLVGGSPECSPNFRHSIPHKVAIAVHYEKVNSSSSTQNQCENHATTVLLYPRATICLCTRMFWPFLMPAAHFNVLSDNPSTPTLDYVHQRRLCKSYPKQASFACDAVTVAVQFGRISGIALMQWRLTCLPHGGAVRIVHVRAGRLLLLRLLRGRRRGRFRRGLDRG